MKKEREDSEKKHIDHIEELLEIRTKELRESEEKYRELFEEAPYAYFSIGIDKSIKRCNKAAERLLNYSKEELLNMAVPDLYADTKNGLEKAIGVFQRFLNGEEIYDEELQMKTKNGKLIWIILSVKPVLDANGKTLESRSIVRDITERKKAEQKLKESETWLSTTLNSIGDAVIATDNNGHISFLNPVSESLTDWKHNEAIGKPIEDVFNIINEKTRKRVESPVSRVLREGVIIGLANHTILVAKNGKEIPIADSGAPLINDKGDTIGVVLVFRDITEQRKAEHIIEERVKELNCLYSISKIVEEEFIEINELLSQSVVFLPPAWQFPEVTCARIVVDGQEYKTDNFKETKWKQASDIIIEKEKIGTVEIYYLEEMPEFDEGPFLKEERHLIDSLAAVLGIYLERKKKEEEIRLQSEIIENMSEGVYLIKLNDGTIVYTNPAFEEMFGYNPGEMIGIDVAIVNAPIDKKPEETRDEIMGILKETGEWHGEVLNVKKDGTPFWCYANVSLFDHPEYGRVIISVHTDITERKQVEQELMIKEFAIRSSINAIAIANLKGILTYVNPSFLTLWGYSSDTEVLGNFNRDYWKSKEKADEIVEHIQKTGNWVGELSAKKKDGSYFYVQLSASMIYDINSKPISILASFIDITDRKKAEKEMNNALEEIKRSNAELEQFAYIASHDLQEPLRMVSGFANLLEKRYKESLDEDAHEFIDFIIDGASRMHDLINDLLTYSRIGTQGIVFKPTDMNVVLEASLNNVRISAIETNAIITNDPLPVIIAEESQMVQLLQNLISNAIKFHGPVPPKIHIIGEVKKDEWIFTVQDNGIGIDSKNFERIFVIFQRLDKKGESPGTGIGLAVCKKIIQRHGGKIWVESELKKGSIFHFSIPRNQNEVSTSKKVLYSN